MINKLKYFYKSILKKDIWYHDESGYHKTDWKGNLTYIGWPSGYEQFFWYTDDNLLIRQANNEGYNAHYWYSKGRIIRVEHVDQDDTWYEYYNENLSGGSVY
mgnify:FL=1|tara:strand:+ start:49 stop:354 length:306 start_codon:yes stop_codon:yes gene_type:complete